MPRMLRPVELYIGLRYMRAKRRNHFISFISMISMGGIALGVTALIAVLSVMNGFERELRERILGMASHATVAGYEGPLQAWSEVRRFALDSGVGILGAAPYIEGEGMLRNGSRLSGTLLRGVSPKYEAEVSDVGEHMLSGKLDELVPGGFRIVLGKELADILQVKRGDKVDLMIPQTTVTPAGIIPRFRRFTVSGIFEVGMYEYDRSLVLLHMSDAAALYQLGNNVTGIRLKLEDMFQAPRVSRELARKLPQGSYYVTDWTRQHENFFRAVATEKTVMFIILTLIVAVAAFNIVSTLVMVVTDKQADIAILRTLGATPRSIMAIFMVQGSLIGVIGTVLGVIFGVLLTINIENIVPFVERIIGRQFLASDVYYITQLKGELHWEDVGKIAGVSLVLSLLASRYPAKRASRMQPAEALRYE
jgi:lipoprotein-releasing system permease protein